LVDAVANRGALDATHAKVGETWAKGARRSFVERPRRELIAGPLEC
jgi:hypothetical protein